MHSSAALVTDPSSPPAATAMDGETGLAGLLELFAPEDPAAPADAGLRTRLRGLVRHAATRGQVR